ncbi:hypothetical protein GQ53DRAFT_752956 [Thozetella sp. PMI_491]|nr:hypothetical protein GQ53DRAFT_752956 [Thozetella sp. PMI_491]
MLVVAYARSSNQDNHLYDIVERLVICDDVCAATLDGLECLVLLAKSYTDIGQPRRAWATWRRGIMLALLMDLHRKETESPVERRLWLAIYHGDRFTSLLLGLPHGFHDAFLSVNLRTSTENGPSPLRFVQETAFVAGKVIERNVSTTKPSFALAMLLDEEMHKIRGIMLEEWWTVTDVLPSSHEGADDLRERLLQQFFFYHVLMYIHLPFLGSDDYLHDASRISCMMAASQMLRRYKLFRAEGQGGVLFDCKTSDFVAFTAAVVIQIGLYGAGSKQSEHHEHMQLVVDIEEILHRERRARECRLAAQCLHTLSVLSSWGRRDASCYTTEIAIPYFGVVARKQHATQNDRTPAASIHDTVLSAPTAPANRPAAKSSSVEEPCGEYWDFNMACPTSRMFGADDNLFPEDELQMWMDMWSEDWPVPED